MNNLPTNNFDLRVRQYLVEALDPALAEDAITAIVLTGTGKGFSGGANICEFGTQHNLVESNLLALMVVVGKPMTSERLAALLGQKLIGRLEDGDLTFSTRL